MEKKASSLQCLDLEKKPSARFMYLTTSILTLVQFATYFFRYFFVLIKNMFSWNFRKKLPIYDFSSSFVSTSLMHIRVGPKDKFFV